MKRVAVVGGGNWGTTVSKLIAENVARHREDFDSEVKMWMHGEDYDGCSLINAINENHVNPVYLKDVKLPKNLKAVGEFSEIENCDIFVFCIPHQFVDRLKDLKVKKGSFGLNLGKGLIEKNNSLYAPSEYISNLLGIQCSSMMGANIANEVAEERLTETTVGYIAEEHVDYLRKILQGPYFMPSFVPYNRGMEICAAMKNIVSTAYGIIYGMTNKKVGNNTLSIVFRRGLLETKKLCEIMGGNFDCLSSACVGDLLASCLCGRNFQCGAEIGKKGVTVEEFEKQLNGMKLQGPSTAKTIYKWLVDNKHDIKEFPITVAIYKMCSENKSSDILLELLRN